MKRIILALALTIILVSCAPDPRKQAEADATRMTAEAESLAAEQQRKHAQDLHEYEMQNRRAAQDERNAAIAGVIQFAGAMAKVTAAMLMLALGVSGVWAMLATTKAYSKYAHMRAETLAQLIPLDVRTRQYPLIKYEHNGIYSLTNPNDGSVVMLDSRNAPDRAKIQAMANVQFAGALAREARMSHRPGEITKINAEQIIDGE